MNRILVLGAGGQVGRELMRVASDRLDLWGASRSEADITDRDTIAAAVREADLVVNCAAYTAVDRAEAEAAAAFHVNRDGAAVVAQACAVTGVPLIHLSTDFVFDGRASRPWREDDAVAPLGVYGASKAAGEAAIREILPAHVILRTSWVFGAFGANFVKTVRRLAGEGRSLRIVDDQTGGPTPAADLARAILAIAAHMLNHEAGYGTYHFGGQPAVTWAGFAEAIVERSFPVGAAPPVGRISSAEFGAAASRPAYSVLDCSRIAEVFGLVQPDWRPGLDAVIDELDAGKEAVT